MHRRNEDERHEDEPMSWLFLIEENADAESVADDYWSPNGTCLDIAVEITTVADFLAGKEGEAERFSIPLQDREAFCEACGKDYAVWEAGVDPCPFCGAVPQEDGEE